MVLPCRPWVIVQLHLPCQWSTCSRLQVQLTGQWLVYNIHRRDTIDIIIIRLGMFELSLRYSWWLELNPSLFNRLRSQWRHSYDVGLRTSYLNRGVFSFTSYTGHLVTSLAYLFRMLRVVYRHSYHWTDGILVATVKRSIEFSKPFLKVKLQLDGLFLLALFTKCHCLGSSESVYGDIWS